MSKIKASRRTAINFAFFDTSRLCREEIHSRPEKQCEVCELAKPPKKAATKTAIKNTTLTLFPPPDSTRRTALTKPAEKSSIKIVDRRSGALTKPAGDGKSAALESSASPEVLTPPDNTPDKTVSEPYSRLKFLSRFYRTLSKFRYFIRRAFRIFDFCLYNS